MTVFENNQLIVIGEVERAHPTEYRKLGLSTLESLRLKIDQSLKIYSVTDERISSGKQKGVDFNVSLFGATESFRSFLTTTIAKKSDHDRVRSHKESSSKIDDLASLLSKVSADRLLGLKELVIDSSDSEFHRSLLTDAVKAFHPDQVQDNRNRELFDIAAKSRKSFVKDYSASSKELLDAFRVELSALQEKLKVCKDDKVAEIFLVIQDFENRVLKSGLTDIANPKDKLNVFDLGTSLSKYSGFIDSVKSLIGVMIIETDCFSEDPLHKKILLQKTFSLIESLKIDSFDSLLALVDTFSQSNTVDSLLVGFVEELDSFF